MVILQLQLLQFGRVKSHLTNGAVSVKPTERTAHGSPLHLRVELSNPFISIELTRNSNIDLPDNKPCCHTTKRAATGQNVYSHSTDSL